MTCYIYKNSSMGLVTKMTNITIIKKYKTRDVKSFKNSVRLRKYFSKENQIRFLGIY